MNNSCNSLEDIFIDKQDYNENSITDNKEKEQEKIISNL